MANESKRGGPNPLGRSLADVLARAKPKSEEELEELEVRSARDARKERLERSGIVIKPTPRQLLLADKLYPTQALASTKRWLAAATRTPGPGPNWCFLCGGMGAGKSVAAAWALSRQDGRYTTLETYLRDYRRYLDDRSPQDRTDLARDIYVRSGLLVLDELGTETDSVLMRASLQWLVENRFARRRHLTLVITNLPKVDVMNRFRTGIYDARTWDRLKADALVVSVDGESMRRAAPGNEGPA